MQGTWQLHACSLPLCCGVYTALRSTYRPPLSKTLKLQYLPNLPLGTPSSWHQSLQDLLWLCAYSFFNDMSLQNVVSLQGIISQGTRKGHGADYQKNQCNADARQESSPPRGQASYFIKLLY